MRYRANGYRHVGGDLPLTPPDYPDTPDEPVTCVECGEEIADGDAVEMLTERMMNDLNGLTIEHHWCAPCVAACLDAHPRGGIVQANLEC